MRLLSRSIAAVSIATVTAIGTLQPVAADELDVQVKNRSLGKPLFSVEKFLLVSTATSFRPHSPRALALGPPRMGNGILPPVSLSPLAGLPPREME